MNLHEIYSKEYPEFIKELILVPEVRRLEDIGVTCGVEYTKFPLFNYKYKYTRLAHSIGVALIVWNFTKNIKQGISGLLHDIATPTFAHVIDFVRNDHVKQESTEDNTFEIIDKSYGIQKTLKKYGLKTEDVADYHIYPIADNNMPMLSADRLEYTLGTAENTKIRTLEEIKYMYDNLKVIKNENGEEELGFSDFNIAKCFTDMVIENSLTFVADEDRFTMQYLADIVKKAHAKGNITEADLYTTESEVILKFTKDEEINKLWNTYINLKEIEIFAEKQEGKYCIKVDAKRRYINPIVETKDGVFRISELSLEEKNNIEDFLRLSFDKWMSSKY